MPANRFFISSEFTKGEEICLDGTEHHHLIHVMRFQEEDAIELVNGKGESATAKILEVKKKETKVQILTTIHHPNQNPHISLVIPVMRMSKLEWVIEKGTELGADGFIIYTADHFEKETISTHQLERLCSIAIASLKQSGRFYLPTIEMAAHLSSILKKEGFFLFGDPNEKKPISRNIDSPTFLITGPEKGFSQKELSSLREKGKSVCLSAYTLRAETAPIAALSVVAIDKIQVNS